MNFESVRSIIDTYIKKNGVEAITGDILNNVLNTMLDDVDTAISSIEPSPGGGGGGTADLSNYYTKAESDARYLALSGGTITGSSFDPLRINSTSNNGGCYINFQNGKAYVGYSSSGFAFLQEQNGKYLAVKSDRVEYNGNTLIHSGNIGSQSVNQVYSNSDGNGAFFGSRKDAIGSGGGATIWTYGVENPLTIHTNGVERLRVSGSGNVLIGNTHDNGGKLQVHGAINVTATNGAINFTNGLVTGNASVTLDVVGSSYARLQTSHYGVAYTCPLCLNPLGGNIGIGTTDPQYKLDVNGKFRAFDNVIIGSSSYEEGRLRVVGKNGDTYVMSVCDYDGWTKFAVFNNGNTEVYGNLIVNGDVASA